MWRRHEKNITAIIAIMSLFLILFVPLPFLNISNQLFHLEITIPQNQSINCVPGYDERFNFSVDEGIG